MSELNAKNALIVSDNDDAFRSIASELKAHGITVYLTTCQNFYVGQITEQKIDFILLNHLKSSVECIDMLNTLRKADTAKVIPVFILVEDENDRIQNALSMGAADYLTPDESTESILQKIDTVFGENDSRSTNAIIDITPMEASLTETGIRVYVIEDDPLLRNLLSIKLERSSFPHEFSSDGSKAIEAMRKFVPDVVILDIMLPGRSGLDVLAEIKADHSLKSIPVIVFSNRDGQDERKKAVELGASAFFVKAMTDLTELVEAIEDLVQ